MLTRKSKDVFYSGISFFLGIVFVFFAIVEISSYDGYGFPTLDIVFFSLIALFCFGAGIYGLMNVNKGNSTAAISPNEKKDMIKILLAAVAFVVAVWAMFHFGVL